MKTPRIVATPTLAAGIILVVVALCGAGLIALHGTTTSVLTVDAYFYLSKAENLIAGRGLTTYWNDGIDRKFFPMHSIVLAPFSWLRAAVPDYWVMAEALYYLLTAAVLARLVFRLERSRSVALFAVVLWLVNPNVLLWHSVPYSEGLATLLLWSAILLCAGGWRSCGTGRFALASALAGMAMATRAEAGLIAPFFLAVVSMTVLREGPSSIPWRRLALGLGLFCGPMLLWWGSIPAEGHAARLSYVAEFRDRFTWQQLQFNFEVLFTSVLFERHLRLPAPWMQLVVIVGSRLYLIAIGLALAGALGWRGRWACVLFLLYQGIHAFWHYAYGRFNLLFLPLTLYMFALALKWIFSAWWRLGATLLLLLCGDLPGLMGIESQGVRAGMMIVGGGLLEGLRRWGPSMASGLTGRKARSADAESGAGRRSGPPLPGPGFLGYALMAALVFVMGSLGHYAILRHKQFMTSDDGRTGVRPAQVQAVVLRIGPERGFLVDVDFPLAYRVGTLTGERVWFSTGLQDFFPAAFDRSRTVEFLREKDIKYILSPEPGEVWRKQYQIPKESADQLVMEKRLPGAELLKWEP